MFLKNNWKKNSELPADSGIIYFDLKSLPASGNFPFSIKFSKTWGQFAGNNSPHQLYLPYQSPPEKHYSSQK